LFKTSTVAADRTAGKYVGLAGARAGLARARAGEVVVATALIMYFARLGDWNTSGRES